MNVQLRETEFVLSIFSAKAPPNLPPGVPLMANYLPIGQPGMAPFAFAVR